MLSLELCRSIHADRQRQVERALRQRRLLDLLAFWATDRDDPASDPRGRDPRRGWPGTRALGELG